MKKLLTILLAVVCLSGCAADIPENEQQFPYTESLDIASFSLSGVKSIRISSGYTGAKLLVTDEDDIKALIGKASVLKGDNPISSRGYYGWSYSLDFYGTAEPDDTDEPLLRFGMFDLNHESTYLTYGTFEEVHGHTYSAMYLTDAAAAEELEILCASLIGEAEFYAQDE